MNGAMIEIDGVMFEKVDDFKCPCCGVGLWRSNNGKASGASNPITVFCGNGKSCESQVTNSGASGKDIEEAIANLAAAVEEERMREYWRDTIMTDDEHREMGEARNRLIRQGL